MTTKRSWITFTARLDEMWKGIKIGEACVAIGNWRTAQVYARDVRQMIEAAERRISGRRQHAKGQGGQPPKN